MEMNEYQKLAMITKKQWDDKDNQLRDAIFGLCGEVGEVADIFKKSLSGVKEYDADHVKKEIGDVMWYIAELCDTLGFEMSEIAELNIEKLRKRHGDSFSGFGNRPAGEN